MSIQKIGASLISQSNEANLGLATINLDFSLIKVEAPAEFKALRNELSVARQNAAEEGMPHVTARKIGALFYDWVPRTPHLIKAYGQRSVEIAQCRTVNPKPTKADGAFAEHVGIDGTGIWAAATSGAHAISMYLLACMLARIWSPSEATAIWTELVQERKKELASLDPTDSLYEQSQRASLISILREDLAQWDASARAWLRAADEAMSKKQKQLMLILNNVDLPVSTNPDLLKNVRKAWVSAMTTVDLLVRGVAQSIEDGSVLLGLSSWHIYPDMLVLGSLPQQTPVDQNDTLVNPGGILTIGLQIQNPRHHNVYWSLSLSHLRYYGGPVTVERSLDTQNHVTIYELWQVAVGSLTKLWGMDKVQMASFLVRLYDYIAPSAHKSSDGNIQYWLQYIALAVEPLLEADVLAKNRCIQLIKYGERRSPMFLERVVSQPIPPLFGVLNLTGVLELIPDEATDGVEVLRSHVQSTKGDLGRGYIIRYAVAQESSAINSSDFEYATAIPTDFLSLKRGHEGERTQSSKHSRWVIAVKAATHLDTSHGDCQLPRFEGEETFPLVNEDLHCHGNLLRWRNAPASFSAYEEIEEYSSYEKPDDDVNMLVDMDNVNPSPIETKHVVFFRVAGDPSRIALYATKAPQKAIWPSDTPSWDPESELTLDTLSMVLSRRLLNSTKLLNHMNNFMNHRSRRNLLTSLRALATVDKIYKMLPGSLAALEVTSLPLCEMSWVRPISSEKKQEGHFCFSPIPMDIGTTFSCIALFQSGSLAIDPKSLESVMAMAAGDSIYISSALVSDPSEHCMPYEVRRVRGSLGKPGIAMLIPPKEPRVRSKSDSDWRQVNHNVFDGKLEDSFQSTSLHLWFTDYVLPIDTGIHGNRGFEVYFLEAVVSLHDRGQWIADLNILGQRTNSLAGYLPSECAHVNSIETSKAIIGTPKLTTIDNWHELLDPAGNAAIVRSTGNWLGRLAATSLSIQLKHLTVVMPNKFCWECVRSTWQALQNELDRSKWQMQNDLRARVVSFTKRQDSTYEDEILAEIVPGHYTLPAGEPVLKFADITRLSHDECLEIMSGLVIIC